MAYPTTSVLDDFNRADGALGSSWTRYNDVASTILSNVLRSPSDWSSYYYNAATYGPDAECYVTIVRYRSLVSIEIRRDTANPGTYYRCSLDNGAVKLFLVNNGSLTSLGSYTLSISNGDSTGIWVHGSNIYAFYKVGAGSWTQRVAGTDSTITGAGYLGFKVDGSSGYVELDNFAGGTEVAASGPTAKQSNPKFGALVRANYW